MTDLHWSLVRCGELKNRRGMKVFCQIDETVFCKAGVSLLGPFCAYRCFVEDTRNATLLEDGVYIIPRNVMEIIPRKQTWLPFLEFAAHLKESPFWSGDVSSN
jgi:hypothetical protein